MGIYAAFFGPPNILPGTIILAPVAMDNRAPNVRRTIRRIGAFTHPDI
jgi:hypothetical protein